MFRWIALLVFASCVSVSGFLRARARRAGGRIPRSSESGLLIAGRLIVALPLFGGVLAYLANPRWMEWAALGMPAWGHWVGVALGSLTAPMAYWVLTTLGANVSETVLTRERQELVTGGPYRWIRHPLYLTGIALFLSIGLMAANWFILLWTLIALLAVRLVVIPREEQELLGRFGERYRGYMATTGALLPAIGPR